jgi:hypothetical protein
MRKIVIQKGTTSTATAPPKTRKRADLPELPYFDEPKRSGSGAWVPVVVSVGIILLLIGICAVVRASRNNSNYEPEVQEPVQESTTQPGKYEPKRYAELNGMTYEEWMRKNNTNNAMLKARLERVKGVRSSKTSK